MQMTDAQVMTLAFSIVVPLSALIYSNSRITDAKVALAKSIDEAKETLRAEMTTLKTDLGGKIDALAAEVRLLNANHESAMKQHVLEFHR